MSVIALAFATYLGQVIPGLRFRPLGAGRKPFEENLNENNLVAPTGFEPVYQERSACLHCASYAPDHWIPAARACLVS